MLLQHEKRDDSMIARKKNEKLVLNGCNPDSIKNECSWDERCVPVNGDHFRGWCIPESLRNAIINN
ncbi:unnamed protein product [Onchocerca flexuosa]|nr:unnamed protein product [Onchocerca flexuosa]